KWCLTHEGSDPDRQTSPPRRALDLAPDAKQVAAPELLDFLSRIAARLERARHGGRLRRVRPADHAAASAEVRRDADMIDADEADRVVDVIDEILDGRRRPPLLVLLNAPQEAGTVFFRQALDVPRRRDAELRTQRRIGGDCLGIVAEI